ncbi:helix-turn-helix transcriptional regulator [Chryseobacterium chendengshani]|uniref:helix-turn-helix domain-containing protein n=1 Tax=Chryseobacterium sp. LJ668 TaxID=2864040 RepID=UPI001C693D06|nr:helix-turn-helix transcriptional regulator [Chryseobacterium sp. LJ668]MBW8522221.1 helix-turn-helix transcriptional regulator [Chryseobacterium sp. LJ668]QYK17865.1 helix-turn-helix transcriptional regulator [Chryseobacterium sp. LJ668]
MFRFYSILFLLFCLNLFFSQSIKHFRVPDSLKNKNSEQLQKAYDKVFRIDNTKAELYANSILIKGKKEKNNDLIYDGYYKIAHTKGLENENGQIYADTLLNLTKNVNTKDYPAKAHIIKGILFNYDWRYSEALDHYIIAQKLSKDKNPDQLYYIKKLLGILKTATDENKEALPLFLEYYSYQKQKINTPDKDIKSYIGSIFSVANSYSKNKQYKNALHFIDIGIKECNKFKDYTHYPYFVSATGIANYYLKNYQKAAEGHLDAEKSFIKNNDYGNLAITYYFLGKINYDTHKQETAVKYFVKADSVLVLSKDFYPITRDGYEVLIDYYKKTGDKERQLKYIDKLFYADSIINNSKQYLSKEIYKKYDTPILLEKKEELIAELDNKNLLLFWCLSVGFIIIITLSYIYLVNKKKIKEYQRQAELLIEKSKERELGLPSQDDNIIKENIHQEKARIVIPDKRLQDIKIKLDEFEKNKSFLRKSITVDSLAKELGTNRDYLSKSVNELKGKNFSQYLNELRINHIVIELNNNERIRKYTISAIAEDVGFNNSESFSNAFKKITGTLPSYYIKLLQEKNRI